MTSDFIKNCSSAENFVDPLPLLLTFRPRCEFLNHVCQIEEIYRLVKTLAAVKDRLLAKIRKQNTDPQSMQTLYSMDEYVEANYKPYTVLTPAQYFKAAPAMRLKPKEQSWRAFGNEIGPVAGDRAYEVFQSALINCEKYN